MYRSDVADRTPQPMDVAIARSGTGPDQPTHYRNIIQLRLQDTHQGIAEILHLDESTVRRFLKRLLHQTLVLPTVTPLTGPRRLQLLAGKAA